MNVVQLFDSFVYRFKPSTIAIDDDCITTSGIDCCLISRYSCPTELWDKLTSAIHNANTGCTIFIDPMSKVRPGYPIPYPVSLALIASSIAIYSDIATVDTGTHNAIIITVYKNNINISKDIIDKIDFSYFNSRIASSLSCGTINLSRLSDIGWYTAATETRQYPTDDNIDVIFTLGSAESPTDNEELRIALRSLERYAKDVGNVYLITDNPPKWVNNVRIIQVPDLYTNNKDANLITKVLHACDIDDVSERFIYWSDDQVLTDTVYLKALIPVHNTRGIDYFANPASKWAMRMRHTLEVVKAHGGDVSCNWDSHVPQPIDKSRFKTIMGSVNFKDLPGLCINTAYFGLKREPKRWPQPEVKDTYENSNACTYTFNKLFVGYNDDGYNAGLREALLDKFDTPSKYEKTTQK